MERLIDRYERKLVEQGLVEPGGALLAELDAEVAWNREDPRRAILAEVLDAMSINSLCFAQPAEPYRTMVDYLASQVDVISPKDNETRLFLHELPVVRTFAAADILARLRGRKAVVIAGHGIVTGATVSPEQAFVAYSSALFACFVKFFADFLQDAEDGRATPIQAAAFRRAVAGLAPGGPIRTGFARGPFTSADQVYRAICQAGRPLVSNGLVDSAMGNISYLCRDTLYISQTGSFLDALEGCIDPCPLDGSACTGITASTELPAHLCIVTGSANRAVLHAHPRFAVIMSLVCGKRDCRFDGRCHILCPEARHVRGIPIVTGESGSGVNSLCNTVPEALRKHAGAIVYGHGVFSAGPLDFNRPFRTLAAIEQKCRDQYFEQLARAGIRI